MTPHPILDSLVVHSRTLFIAKVSYWLTFGRWPHRWERFATGSFYLSRWQDQ